MVDPLFNSALRAHRRNRAAPHFAAHRFLHEAVADDLCERLSCIKRRFSKVLILGAHDGFLVPLLRPYLAEGASVTQLEISPFMAAEAHKHAPTQVGSVEALPFSAHTFDLVISLFELHWCDDLVGALIQIKTILEPDGLLLAAVTGGDTLQELRHVLLEAEMAQTGGAGIRFAPVLDLRDCGALLQRAGFALPAVDRDVITPHYQHATTLLQDLKGMGETLSSHARSRRPLRRATLAMALALYHDRYQQADGSVPATFEIYTLTGWAPAATQPQPLKRGSAMQSLESALKSLSPLPTAKKSELP